MSRPVSTENQLKAARADLNRALRDLIEARRTVVGFKAELDKIISDRDEWKRRFDLLLSKCEVVK